MRSVNDQLERILAVSLPPPPVRAAISEAQGLLCAQEVVAAAALPGFDQAAVDGYAVRSVDVSAASVDDPVELPVVGEIGAGSRAAHRLQPRQAVYVAAGGPLPTIADAIVPRGSAGGSDARIVVNHNVKSGDFVRRTGEDVQPGDVAVRSGAFIGAAQVGLLAAVGMDKVLVHPRPRISILSFGDELVDVSRTPGPGQVFDVNSYALAAAARDAGAEVTRVGIAASSDIRRLREIIEGRLLVSEAMIICGAAGGESGELMRDALADLGDIDTTRVAMQPGSSQSFGVLGPDRVPTFFLPANPVSALVVFEVMVRPSLRVMLGRRNPYRRTVTARTLAPISSPAGRRQFLRGQLMRDEDDAYLVHILGGGGHLLASLADANALVIVDEDVTEVPMGSDVQVSFLANRA